MEGLGWVSRREVRWVWAMRERRTAKREGEQWMPQTFEIMNGSMGPSLQVGRDGDDLRAALVEGLGVREDAVHLAPAALEARGA